MKEIQDKMEEIVQRWKGTEEKYDTPIVHCRRVVDRITYRDLKKKLHRMQQLNPPQPDVIAMAEEIFGAQAQIIS